MITGELIRAARALLDWSQDELAARVGVGKRAILSAENGVSIPHERTLARIRDVFQEEGVEMFTTEEGALGLTVSKATLQRLRTNRADARATRG